MTSRWILANRPAVITCTRPVFTSTAAYRDSLPWRWSVQRLNRGLLVHTEHGGMLRQIQRITVGLLSRASEGMQA